jgi:biotin carboxylase
MKHKVVIIGHGYTSRLSIIRSVAEIGCDVTVIVMTISNKREKPIDCYSKYVSRFYYCGRSDGKELIRLLLDKCIDPEQKVVLIPDGDDVVAAIDTHLEQLKEHFLFPHINHEEGAILRWMDKEKQKSLAREIGLNVANSHTIEIVDGNYLIPAGIQYPCFPKPLATASGGKGGMRRCNNVGDLKSALDYIIKIRNKSQKILVEDYKEIDTEYALLGFSDGKEIMIPGVLQFLKVSKQHTGIALQGKIMPVASFEDIIKQFKQMVLQVGFIGVFDIDFYKSHGNMYFCELNMRFGGSGYAYTKTGVNFPAMLVKYLHGESVGMSQTINQTAVYVNERMCLDDWKNFVLSTAEYRNYLRSADIRFIPDDSDPDPEKAYLKEYRKIRFQRPLRWLKGKTL